MILSDEPKQRAHSPLIAAVLASELKTDTIVFTLIENCSCILYKGYALFCKQLLTAS